MALREVIDHALDCGLHVVGPIAGCVRRNPLRDCETAGGPCGVGVRHFDFTSRVRGRDDDCRAINCDRQDRQATVVRVLADQVDTAGRASREDLDVVAEARTNLNREPRGARQFFCVPSVRQTHRRFLFGLNHARAASRSSGVPTSLQNPRMSTARTTRPSAIICAIAPGISSSPRAEGSSRAM